MRLRILAAAVAATVAVTGLAGCRTNVGVAAKVDGQPISESDVSQYVNPTGVSSAVAAQAQAAHQTASPRSQVLQYLIQEQVFEHTLAAINATPTAGQLAAAHDPAAQLLLQTQLSGAKLDDALKKGLPDSGIKSSFASVYLRVQELEYTLIQKRQLTQLSDLVALTKQAHVDVWVSPRYGKWNPSTLSLSGKTAVPSYVSVQPTAAGGAAGGQAAPVG